MPNGTLADFKRYCILGAELTMVYHRYSDRTMPWHRKVTKVQTNGVWMIDPTDKESKESFLEWPKATDLVWDGCTRVLIYDGAGDKREHLMSYKLKVAIDMR